MTSQKDLRSGQKDRKLKTPVENRFVITHDNESHAHHHVHRTVIESITTRFVSDGNGGLKAETQVIKRER